MYIVKVDIVKISDKWTCSVCNAKQKLRKEVSRGSSSECRLKVQELNLKRGLEQDKKMNKNSFFSAKITSFPCKDLKTVTEIKLEKDFNKSAKDENYIEDGVILFSFSNDKKWTQKKNHVAFTSTKTSSETVPSDEFTAKKSKWDDYL